MVKKLYMSKFVNFLMIEVIKLSLLLNEYFTLHTLKKCGLKERRKFQGPIGDKRFLEKSISQSKLFCIKYFYPFWRYDKFKKHTRKGNYWGIQISFVL